MNKKNFTAAIVILVTLRIIVSLVVSDGKVRSDSLTYVGLAVNIIEHGTFTAIVPADESIFKNGMSLDALYAFHSATDSPYRRLMNYQWFHVLVYLPVIVLFHSLSAIIILNNLLFAWTGLVLLGLVRSTADDRWQLLAYGFFLFFPPFFYLTNQFLTEPLFILLLSIVTTALIQNKKIGWAETAAFIALSITRGFGLFLLAGYIIISLWKKQYRSAAMMVFCGIASMTINHFVAAHDPDPSRIIIPSPAPLMHSVYFANTIHGNGDNDFFLAYPEKAVQDTFFQSYVDGKIGNGAVVRELFRQNTSNPKKSIELTVNRIFAYFLNIIPDSWNYLGTPPQPVYRKILWGIQNVLILILIIAGWSKASKEYKTYYAALFIISFIVHFVAIARYRYFFPALVLGLPAIAMTFQHYLSGGVHRLFKKQNAPK